METNKIDPYHLRHVAGAFATGITIVSVRNEKGETLAMTANSFVSVSLDPALVLFSIGKMAHMTQFMIENQKIGISVLCDHQQEISNYYGGLTSVKPVTTFEEEHGCPIIRDNLAWYAAVVKKIIPAGDHDLILCQILACHRNEGQPLIYFNGYQSLKNDA